MKKTAIVNWTVTSNLIKLLFEPEMVPTSEYSNRIKCERGIVRDIMPAIIPTIKVRRKMFNNKSQ